MQYNLSSLFHRQPQVERFVVTFGSTLKAEMRGLHRKCQTQMCLTVNSLAEALMNRKSRLPVDGIHPVLQPS